jgi:hypothetical protein
MYTIACNPQDPLPVLATSDEPGILCFWGDLFVLGTHQFVYDPSRRCQCGDSQTSRFAGDEGVVGRWLLIMSRGCDDIRRCSPHARPGCRVGFAAGIIVILLMGSAESGAS